MSVITRTTITYDVTIRWRDDKPPHEWGERTKVNVDGPRMWSIVDALGCTKDNAEDEGDGFSWTFPRLLVEVKQKVEHSGLYEGIERCIEVIRGYEEVVPVDVMVETLQDLLAHDRHRRDHLARERYGEGHCRHGVYVGGCGIDWMCQRCEMGEE